MSDAVQERGRHRRVGTNGMGISRRVQQTSQTAVRHSMNWNVRIRAGGYKWTTDGNIQMTTEALGSHSRCLAVSRSAIGASMQAQVRRMQPYQGMCSRELSLGSMVLLGGIETAGSPRVDGCSLCRRVRWSPIQCSRPLVADSIHNNEVGYNYIKYSHISNKRHMHHLRLQKTQPE